MRETIDERNEGLEIDLQKLIMAYLRKWWLILLCGIILAAGAWAYTANCITPLYQAEVSVYVNNIRSSQQIEYLSESNLAASQRLVNTYINIVKSNRVLDKVAEELKGDYTTEDLQEMLSAAQVDKT
jgi:capsular polysaccharide biosynthesis protein